MSTRCSASVSGASSELQPMSAPGSDLQAKYATAMARSVIFFLTRGSYLSRTNSGPPPAKGRAYAAFYGSKISALSFSNS